MAMGLILTGLAFSVMAAGVSAALGASSGLVMVVYAVGGATAVMSAVLSMAEAPHPL